MKHKHTILLKTKLLIISVGMLPILFGVTLNLTGSTITFSACTTQVQAAYERQKNILDRQYGFVTNNFNNNVIRPNPIIPGIGGNTNRFNISNQQVNLLEYMRALQVLENEKNTNLQRCSELVMNNPNQTGSLQCNATCVDKINFALNNSADTIAISEEAVQQVVTSIRNLTGNSGLFTSFYDVNGDGTFDDIDVAIIEQYLLMKLDVFQGQTNSNGSTSSSQRSSQASTRHQNDILQLNWTDGRRSFAKDTSRLVDARQALKTIEFTPVTLNSGDDLAVQIHYFANGQEHSKQARFIVNKSSGVVGVQRTIPTITFNSADLTLFYVPEDNEFLGNMMIEVPNERPFLVEGGLHIEANATDFTIHNITIGTMSPCNNCTSYPPFTRIETSAFGNWENTSNGMVIRGQINCSEAEYSEINTITATVEYLQDSQEFTETITLNEILEANTKYTDLVASSYSLLAAQVSKINNEAAMYLNVFTSNTNGKRAARYNATIPLRNASNTITIKDVTVNITTKTTVNNDFSVDRVHTNSKTFIEYSLRNPSGKVVRAFNSKGEAINYGQNTLVFKNKEFLELTTLQPITFTVYEQPANTTIAMFPNSKPLEVELVTLEQLQQKSFEQQSMFSNVQKRGASITFEYSTADNAQVYADIYYDKNTIVSDVKALPLENQTYIINNNSQSNIQYVVLYTKSSQGVINNVYPHYFEEWAAHPLNINQEPRILQNNLVANMSLSKEITHNLGIEVGYPDTIDALYDITALVNNRKAEIQFNDSYQTLPGRYKYRYTGTAHIQAEVYPYERTITTVLRVINNKTGKYVQFNQFTTSNPNYDPNAPVVNHGSAQQEEIEMRTITSNPYAPELIVTINNATLANYTGVLNGTYTLDRDDVYPSGLAARGLYRVDYDGVERGTNVPYPNSGNLKSNTIIKRADGSIQFSLPLQEFGGSYGYAFSFSDASTNQSIITVSTNENPLTKDVEIQQPYTVTLAEKNVIKNSDNSYNVEYKGYLIWQAQGIASTKAKSPMQNYSIEYAGRVIEPALQQREGSFDNQVLFGFRVNTNNPTQEFTFKSTVEFARESLEFSETLQKTSRCSSGICLDYAIVDTTESGELSIEAHARVLTEHQPGKKRYILVKTPNRAPYYHEITALNSADEATVQFTTVGQQITESTIKPFITICYEQITQIDQVTLRENCLVGLNFKDFVPEPLPSKTPQGYGKLENLSHQISNVEDDLRVTISGKIKGYSAGNFTATFNSIYVTNTPISIASNGTFTHVLGTNGDTSENATKELIEYVQNNGLRQSQCFTIIVKGAYSQATSDRQQLCE